MNLHWNFETIFLVSGIIISTLGSLIIMRNNWKQYALLYLIVAVSGNLVCYVFIRLGLYIFPYRLFPELSIMPVFAVMTIFPFYVLFSVRYSPAAWSWKIPFYWVMVHIGMLIEVLLQNFTEIIKYKNWWNTWTSYTWWWIFLLVFECIGGVIVSPGNRKPISHEKFQFGKVGWFLTHFTLIGTIFMAGVYFGLIMSGNKR